MVLIIDYGMSNLGSIRRFLEECGASVSVSDNPKDLKYAERIILPGVGSFIDGMKNLRKRELDKAIREEVLLNKIPLLGICLGMQLLADKGFEGGEVDGLGLINGTVIKLKAESVGERIPHVGWNEVYPTKEKLLFNGIQNGSDFYFVHSYHFVPTNSDNIISTTPYAGNFVSAVNSENIFGVQFHPEKSVPAGFMIMKNFLNFA